MFTLHIREYSRVFTVISRYEATAATGKNRINLFALEMKAELCGAVFAIGQSGGKCVGIRVILCDPIKKPSRRTHGRRRWNPKNVRHMTASRVITTLITAHDAARPRTTGLSGDGGTARSSFSEARREAPSMRAGVAGARWEAKGKSHE